MTSKQLISITDLKVYRPIGDLTEDRALPYIVEAQQIDLRSILGDSLYVDFMTRVDVTADSKYAVYQELLKGKNYTYSGTVYEHPGLIGYLAYMSLAKIYAGNSINVTKYGVTQKKQEDSEPVSREIILQEVNALRSMGMAMQAQIILFLQRNPVAYPLFNSAEAGSLNPSFSFFDPDKQSVRSGRTNISY